MSLGLGWKLHGDGRTMGPDDVVAPDERLSWGKTVGLGAQHVVAMFGATFVFPLIMGLNAQLAIMMSGVATICFLLIVKGKVPSYLGTSASFVGAVVAIRAQDGATSATVTGAILVAGLVLALVGVLIHFLGSGVLHKVLPPVVTGAVVMLIGFNLAPVVANIYWPQDQWVALLVMTFTIVCAVAFKGFIGRIAIFLALIFGYVAVLALRQGLRADHRPTTPVPAKITTHFRTNFQGIKDAAWFGFPPHTEIVAGKEVVGWHAPSFSMAAILLVVPAVIALIAENTGHVKAVAEMTKTDLDPVHGPRDRCRRLRHRRWPPPSVAHRRRPTPRTSGSWPPPGSTRRPPTTSPPSWRSCSASRRSSAPSWPRPRWGARRDHGGALRHDRPAGSQDLEGERRRLRQPDQPGARRRRHRHRHRQRDAEVHRQLLPHRHRARHHRGRRRPTTSPRPSRPAELRARADGALLTVGGHDTYGDSDGVDDLDQGDTRR